MGNHSALWDGYVQYAGFDPTTGNVEFNNAAYFDYGKDKGYPAAAQSLCQRAKRYNDSVALARLLARQGKVLVVAPKNTFGVDTLTRDRDALEKLYQEGYADGEKIETFLKQGR